jgi:hypothetical protein
MNMQKIGTVAAAKVVLVAAGLFLAIPPGFATENAQERRDARDTKQDSKQTARKEKVDCKAANQKNNSQCRHDKRDTKQEGRKDSRDVRSGDAPK